MNVGTIRLLANWLACVFAFMGLSVVVSRAFGLVVLALTDPRDISRLYQLEIRYASARVFLACLFCGALYLSAMAKPSCFGGAARIWKHLGGSYALNLLGCVLLIRTLYIPLPNFESNFVLSASAFCGIAISILCFVFALLIWVRLAFGTKPDIGSKPAQELPTKG